MHDVDQTHNFDVRCEIFVYQMPLDPFCTTDPFFEISDSARFHTNEQYFFFKAEALHSAVSRAVIWNNLQHPYCAKKLPNQCLK
jgi:hypothetical protein